MTKWAMMILATVAALAPQAARSQQEDAPQEIARPADVETWPTVGATIRLDRAHGETPWQMRQVLMAPRDYQHFAETGAFADGTTFAVLFYPVVLDRSQQPPLYHAQAEQAFALEVIDRSHPDGRRFYTFAFGSARAAPLAPGNECAACHNARGSFDGTFARMYPQLARRLDRAGQQ